MEENNEPQFNQSSQPPVTRSTYDPNEGRNRKIIILLVLVFVILAILAVGGVLLYKIKKNQPIKQSQASVDKAVFDKAISDTYKSDKDFDGISDEDEKKYGTSPTLSDTDEDGLTDDSEINTYKTDPLKADTDGDGYEDGFEVRRGLDPKGFGSL